LSSKFSQTMHRWYVMSLRKTILGFRQSKYLLYLCSFQQLILASLERMSYDASTCKMIFHFLPSDVHNAAVASFDDMLTATLDLLPFNQPARQYKHRGNTSK
jgi:hypothetical protein